MFRNDQVGSQKNTGWRKLAGVCQGHVEIDGFGYHLPVYDCHHSSSPCLFSGKLLTVWCMSQYILAVILTKEIQVLTCGIFIWISSIRDTLTVLQINNLDVMYTYSSTSCWNCEFYYYWWVYCPLCLIVIVTFYFCRNKLIHLLFCNILL